MPRLLFCKTGEAVWMSHLDLMRVFQRAFKRAGLPLTHSHGFNPRASVSIALPLSVGVESRCELLDFELDGQKIPCEEIVTRLNGALVSGVCVTDCYEEGRKIRDLALLRCKVALEYFDGVPRDAVDAIRTLFSRPSLPVMKKGKNGPAEQDVIPMIRSMEVVVAADDTIELNALVCCQNPSLNPMQLAAAIERYLPQMKADFVRCSRVEIYDTNENVFR